MKKSVSLLLTLVILFSLTACGGGSTQTDTAGSGSAETEDLTSDEPKYGGSLTIQYDNFNTVFDPAMGESYCYDLWAEHLWCMNWGLDDPDTYAFQENVYTMDEVQGQIADQWNWDADTMQLTVTIRNDIYFQEKNGEYNIFGGRNLTAEDVKYSYDRLTGLGSGFTADTLVYIDSDWASKLSMLDSVEVTDTYTVVFHLNTASETKLSDFMVAAVDITGPEWDSLTDEQKNDWHYACGTGPYILTDFVADNHYTFTRNENYYDYDERYPENKLPYLDEIILQKYGDTTSAISGFIAGDLDYINVDASLSDSEKNQIQDNVKGVTVQTFASGAEAMNLKINSAPFDDINVRKAMQLAINLEEVNSDYYGYDELDYAGVWSPSRSDYQCEWSDELLSEYQYDPDKARELLTEAGYPDGFEFTVAVSSAGNMDVFQMAKSYLANVGITMNIEGLSDMMELMILQSAENDNRCYNDWMGNITSMSDAYQNYKTDRFDWGNYFNNTDIVDMLTNAYSAQTMDEQAQYAQEAEEYILSQHWSIALSGMTAKYAYVSSSVGGLENGELLTAGVFMGTITARLWANS